MNCKLFWSVIVCLGLSAAPLFAFTYQGRLYDDGSPAQGTYDMSFTLYDAAEGGTAVTSACSVPRVLLTNGYFTVNLDFPAAQSLYNGQGRWLQIAVRKSGTTDPLTTLSPRYSLTAVPYAERAHSADRVKPLAFLTDHIAKVEIEGQDPMYFHYFNVFEKRMQVISNNTVKIPGPVRLGDIELRGFADRGTFFYDWLRRCETYVVAVERKTIRLSVLDRKGTIREQWLFEGCFPWRVQYDHDPALGGVVQTVIFKAATATRPVGAIGHDGGDWLYGPQPVMTGPFILRPEGLEPQTFESFYALGLQAVIVESSDPHAPLASIDVSPLDAVFTRTAANDPDMAGWFGAILTGQAVPKTVGFSLDREGEPLIRGRLLESWPCAVTSAFDPVSRQMKESIELVVAEMEME